MGFSEKVKLEVKKKAAFKCCWCQKVSVEVHHILPQKHGGSDDIENAAPLCSYCHTLLGDNPAKKKEITQMRDWWYETVQKKYSSPNTDFTALEKIDRLVDLVETNKTEIKELKATLREYANTVIDNITPATARHFASNITSSSSSSTLTIPLSKGQFLENRNSDISIIGEGMNSVTTIRRNSMKKPFGSDEGEGI